MPFLTVPLDVTRAFTEKWMSESVRREDSRSIKKVREVAGTLGLYRTMRQVFRSWGCELCLQGLQAPEDHY